MRSGGGAARPFHPSKFLDGPIGMLAGMLSRAELRTEFLPEMLAPPAVPARPPSAPMTLGRTGQCGIRWAHLGTCAKHHPKTVQA